MREIKFRGESYLDNEWIYGYLSKKQNMFYIQNRYSVDCFKYKRFIVDPKTIGQYTGLKDKNGVEIYDGDILKCDGLRIVIQYSGCAFEGRYLGPQKDLWSPIRNNNYLQWVVIGNIHQNPELLNQ